MVNIMLFTPMPSAIAVTAARVNPGLFVRIRQANRMSGRMFILLIAVSIADDMVCARKRFTMRGKCCHREASIKGRRDDDGSGLAERSKPYAMPLHTASAIPSAISREGSTRAFGIRVACFLAGTYGSQ